MVGYIITAVIGLVLGYIIGLFVGIHFSKLIDSDETTKDDKNDD